MTTDKNRWHLAQDYEKEWWKSRQSDVNFDFYKNYANELKFAIKGYIQINSNTKILEIGSGAGGIITFLNESNNRFAIDPLENFYSSVQSFVDQRDKNVKYKTAMGEELPFENKFFDLVIMDNVLDHCENPQKVMEQVNRVLTEEGLIYFKQNTYNYWGLIVRFLMEKFLIDKGHPHTFLKNKLLKLIEKNNFKVISSFRSGYFKTWMREIRSKNLKDKLKAILFVTRDKVTYLITK